MSEFGFKLRKEDKGIALVSVMIVVALIAVLASSILHLSYLAYARKLVEKRNTENFYAAESVIDTVKAVIQNSAASAISSASESTDAFLEDAFKAITGESGSVGTSASATAVTTLKQAILNRIQNEGATDSTGTSVYAAITTNGGTFDIEGSITIEDDLIRIGQVHVIYVNDEGYQSEITTDIVINAPVYASDIDVPVGTYSMFAGNGAKMEASGALYYQPGGDKIQMTGINYLHQEGNTYVGYKDDTMTALELTYGDEHQKHSLFASFGGTNVVMNGDVWLNGMTLIFSGGDGTENVNIQVNGYIVLNEGATLLLPSNVNLVCKGIVTDLSYSGSTAMTTPYTGDGAEATISQFYPFSESYSAIQNSNVYKSYFVSSIYDSEVDVAMVLGDINNGNIGADATRTSNGDGTYTYNTVCERYWKLVSNASNASGVYILNAETDADGWTNRQNDEYKLVTYNSATGTWSSSQIICNPDAEKLQRDYEENKKITYNGKSYDKKFSDIVNIPLLVNINNPKIISVFTNYNTLNSSTYTEIDINDILLNASSNLFYPYISTLKYKFDWEGDDGMNGVLSDAFGTRSFRMPTDNMNFSSWSGTSYSITAKDLTESNGTRVYGTYGVFLGYIDNTNINGSENEFLFYFYVSTRSFTVHVTGDYSGLFMSSESVNIGQSSGKLVRGISLIELANQTTENPGMETDESTLLTDGVKNSVQKFLVEMAAGRASIMNNSYNPINDDKYSSLVLVDNIFNGGVSIFWDETKMGGSGNSTTASDNSSVNFIDVDNWQRDQ